MVRCHLTVIFVCAIPTLSAYALEPPAPVVSSAPIVQHTPLTIKPCQAVCAVLEITVDRGLSLSEWGKMVRSISQVVWVNDRRFGNRLSNGGSLNDAATFELLPVNVPEDAEPLQTTYDVGQILVSMFMNAEDRECLFLEPGEYNIRFVVGAHTPSIKVRVEPTDNNEQKIVDEINQIKVLLFLSDPTDRQYAKRETITLLDSWARENTSYAKMLSLAAGIGWSQIPPEGALSGENVGRHRIAWAKHVYDVLNPHCVGKMTSPREATAAARCAEAAGLLASGEANQIARERYRTRQIELWSQVAESPLSGREMSRAKERLDKLIAGRKNAP